MIASEFAIDLARLAKAATTLRTLMPFTPPVRVRLDSIEHDATFFVDVFSVSTSFCLQVFADGDPTKLAQGTVERSEDMLQDIAHLVELAEEEFTARKHRGVLLEAIADHDPDPAELLAFCEKAGIEINKGVLSVEDCATISSWLQIGEVRAKAAARPSVVVDFRSGEAI